jgi:hypothetical protein
VLMTVQACTLAFAQALALAISDLLALLHLLGKRLGDASLEELARRLGVTWSTDGRILGALRARASVPTPVDVRDRHVLAGWGEGRQMRVQDCYVSRAARERAMWHERQGDSTMMKWGFHDERLRALLHPPAVPTWWRDGLRNWRSWEPHADSRAAPGRCIEGDFSAV